MSGVMPSIDLDEVQVVGQARSVSSQIENDTGQSDHGFNVDEQRERLQKMSDADLRTLGQAAQIWCLRK